MFPAKAISCFRNRCPAAYAVQGLLTLLLLSGTGCVAIPQMARGFAQMESGRPISADVTTRSTAEAVAALEHVRTSHPNSAHSQHAAGLRLLDLGSIREGLLALERAVVLEPLHSQYAQDLAAAYLRRRNLPAAQMVLTQAIQSRPNDVGLAAAAARLFESDANWVTAEYYYTTALAQDPENRRFREQRGRCRYRQGNYAGAVADLADLMAEPQDETFSLVRLEYADALERTRETPPHSTEVIPAPASVGSSSVWRDLERMRLSKPDPARTATFKVQVASSVSASAVTICHAERP